MLCFHKTPLAAAVGLLVLVLAPPASGQTGFDTNGITHTGFRGQETTNAGFGGIMSEIQHVTVPAVGTKVFAWCGIDNNGLGNPGTTFIQVGWEQLQGASVPLTYWEYVPDHGVFPDNAVRGLGSTPTPNALYKLEELWDPNGQHVVWCGVADGSTGLLFQSISWSEFDKSHFCCWFCGFETKETYTDRAPGTSTVPNCFSGMRVKEGGVWSISTPSHDERRGSYWVYLSVTGDNFCVYDIRN
jgi:hypothetical protein